MKNELGRGDIVHNEQLFNLGISGYGQQFFVSVCHAVVYARLRIKNVATMVRRLYTLSCSHEVA